MFSKMLVSRKILCWIVGKSQNTMKTFFFKGDVGNAILNTKGKIVLARFSICNKQTGVS